MPNFDTPVTLTDFDLKNNINTQCALTAGCTSITQILL